MLFPSLVTVVDGVVLTSETLSGTSDATITWIFEHYSTSYHFYIGYVLAMNFHVLCSFPPTLCLFFSLTLLPPWGKTLGVFLPIAARLIYEYHMLCNGSVLLLWFILCCLANNKKNLQYIIKEMFLNYTNVV